MIKINFNISQEPKNSQAGPYYNSNNEGNKDYTLFSNWLQIN